MKRFHFELLLLTIIMGIISYGLHLSFILTMILLISMVSLFNLLRK